MTYLEADLLQTLKDILPVLRNHETSCVDDSEGMGPEEYSNDDIIDAADKVEAMIAKAKNPQVPNEMLDAILNAVACASHGKGTRQELADQIIEILAPVVAKVEGR